MGKERLMGLAMAGLDYSTAPVEIREQLRFAGEAAEEADRQIAAMEGVEGAVILSTCNRTELYMMGGGEPLTYLCRAAGVHPSFFRDAARTRRGEDGARHLMEVACGLKSQMLGEDQIVSQVKTAIALAREAGSTCAVLETLFRDAVSCGKAARAGGRLACRPVSAAHEAVERIRERLGELRGKRALVIGNGEMGRLAASLLRDAGCAVTVTLRTYRRGGTVVPAGCAAAPYEHRYAAMEGMDFLVSATASPHYTVTAEPFAAVRNPPGLLVDLALPRDIQPDIPSNIQPNIPPDLSSGKTTITIWNLDDLGSGGGADEAALARTRRLVEEWLERFYQWYKYRECLPAWEEIKQAVLERVGSLPTEDAVRKTVDLLAGGIKGGFTPESLAACAAGIRARTR